MNKSDRLTLIRNRYLAIAGCALTQFLPVTRSEIRETAKETVLPITRGNDENILDEEIDGVKSSLPFAVSAPTQCEPEEKILLSRAEKAQLAKDLQEYRLNNFRKAIANNSRFLLLTA